MSIDKIYIDFDKQFRTYDMGCAPDSYVCDRKLTEFSNTDSIRLI